VRLLGQDNRPHQGSQGSRAARYYDGLAGEVPQIGGGGAVWLETGEALSYTEEQ
jgi:hypothetical protein